MSAAAGRPPFLKKEKPKAVVKPGEFRFAAMHLEHSHINGQCSGLIDAGAELVAVYDPDPKKVAAFQKRFPGARGAPYPKVILEDESIRLVAAAAVPDKRGELGCLVMEHGKDYFTDKTPFTTMDQLDRARAATSETRRKYMVYYSERLHVECAVAAGYLIEDGAIGRVIHIEGTGPHRLGASKRPEWFYQKERTGGIICDLASHQLEQFLYYTSNTGGTIQSARVANHDHASCPEFEDFGDLTVLGDNGASGYHRVDWFTPRGLRSWGDGRTIILGTEGYIEMRKYINVAQTEEGNHLYLVNRDGEQHYELAGQVGHPFFGELILDCLNRTENAMTQAHAFAAGQLTLEAQAMADREKAG